MNLELEQLGGEIENQRKRLELAEQTVGRFNGLAASGFVSEVQAQQKTEELLDQRARLQTLERGRSTLERDISTAGYELRLAPLKARQQRANLERGMLLLEQDLTENEARREITVLASRAGYASNIQVEAGMPPAAPSDSYNRNPRF